MHKDLKIFDAKAYWVTFKDDEVGDQVGLAVDVPALGGVVMIGAERASVAVSGGSRILKMMSPALADEFHKRINAAKGEMPEQLPLPVVEPTHSVPVTPSSTFNPASVMGVGQVKQ